MTRWNRIQLGETKFYLMKTNWLDETKFGFMKTNLTSWKQIWLDEKKIDLMKTYLWLDETNLTWWKLIDLPHRFPPECLSTPLWKDGSPWLGECHPLRIFFEKISIRCVMFEGFEVLRFRGCRGCNCSRFHCLKIWYFKKNLVYSIKVSG